MQLPAHLAVNYAVYLIVFGTAPQTHLVPYLAATVLLDADHLVPLLRARTGIVTEKLQGALWRTRFHELYGVVFFSLLATVLWFFNQQLAQLLALAVLLHCSLDFISGETRPLYPWSDIRVQLFFQHTKRNRVLAEVVLGLLLLALIIWQMTSKN